jgi:hypothetical protein
VEVDCTEPSSPSVILPWFIHCHLFQVWEVKFSRAGEFEKLTRAFELTGHPSGIFHFDFNANSSQVATLCKVNIAFLQPIWYTFELILASQNVLR